ncbi:hypothetical protein KEJ17_07230 [Candidatus Bathyarchaeota archaeon]|nr:hypothetical protein [Candidatus Bathyarchaeota archaeon]
MRAQLFKLNLMGYLAEAGWSIVSSNGSSPRMRTVKHGIEAGVESRWPRGSISFGEVKRLMRECKPKPRIILLLTYKRLSNRVYHTLKS